MKLQIYSDLHLEFYKSFPKIERKCDYLVLAGDIGKLSDVNYKEFIQYCSENWKHTIVVLGNHEFYNCKNTYSKLLQKYNYYFSLFDNVTLLEKEKILLEDYEIIGLTMWSYISETYKDLINCPKKIKQYILKNEKKRLVPIGYNGINILFEESKQWLLKNYNPNKKTIIITHHPITQKNVCQDIYKHQSLERTSVFSTNIELNPNNTCICISGHTHFSHDFVDNNIRYISNQMGYVDEINDTNFNDSGLFII